MFIMHRSQEYRLTDKLGDGGAKKITVHVNGQHVTAFAGESVLATLFSMGERAICKNSHDGISGAYCGMGVCHCCLVRVDGREKQRACMTPVVDGMVIETIRSLSDALTVVSNEARA
ncbi:MAG: (2Fe-2S)-binding protein [Xanthomonadaceae bacterium]|nr:(2Fe-2S)-binding protein [Xanthomonadaceae bacterium]